MSDTAAPSAAPISGAPAAEAAPAAPAARPSLFRTDASMADDPILNKPAPKIAPIRDAPRDPNTGKFVPATQRAETDPNAGVIEEIAGGQEQEDDPGQERPEEQPQPSSSFRVEIDGSVFTDEKSLAAHIKRLTAHGSAEARRASELEKMNAQLQARLQPQVEKAPEPASDPNALVNPFEKSALDNEDLIKSIYADLDTPDKGVPVAIFRVVDHLEKQIKSLTDYINKTQEQHTAPMRDFLGAMASINQTSEFMQNMSVATDENGELKYPNMRSRPAIQALTSILHKHNLPLTPENFDLAYQVWQGPSKPGEMRPQERPDPAASRAAAASAGVVSSRGRVPDPRAEPKKLSFAEEMNQVQTHRGMFRTAT